LHGWPQFDPAALEKPVVEIAVQVNGSIKYRTQIPSGIDKAQAEGLIMADPRTEQLLQGKSMVKFIFVPDRLANLVVR
jgi:leucyl-tRNA synthetase